MSWPGGGEKLLFAGPRESSPERSAREGCIGERRVGMRETARFVVLSKAEFRLQPCPCTTTGVFNYMKELALHANYCKIFPAAQQPNILTTARPLSTTDST